MEEQKRNNGGVVAVVILSILLILTSGYIVYYKLVESNNAKTDKAETTDKKTEVTVTEETAKKLFEEQISNYMAYERQHGIEKEVTFTSPLDAIEWILSQSKSNGLTSIGNFCGTALETTLISKDLISAKGEGQFDCTSTPVYKLSDIKLKAKEYFRDADKIDFTVLNIDSSPYMYEASNDSIMVRIAGPGGYNSKYLKYSVSDNVLHISFTFDYYSTSDDKLVESDTYEAKYDIVGNKFYIKSITKTNS